MSEQRFKVSLRLWHPQEHPRSITDALGMTPKITWNVGDRRVTPKDEPLEGTYDTTYWVSDVPIYEGLEKTLRENALILASKKDYLNKFSDGGGSIEYFIGLFADKHAGATIDWELQRLLADLHISISLDIYLGP